MVKVVQSDCEESEENDASGRNLDAEVGPRSEL